MQIALCNDDDAILQMLQSCIAAYFTRTNLIVHTCRFFHAEDFINSTRHFHIVFMGIYHSKTDGIEPLKNIKKKIKCPIVFVADTPKYAIDAFALDAAHYLIKPLTQEAVFQALDRCLARLGEPSREILKVKSSGITIPVPIADITYIEVFNKVCVIHTANRSVQTYTSLDALSRQLNSCLFIRAQRSYLVHMGFIGAFFYDYILLKNGVKVGLARKKRAELKKQYQDYLQTCAMASRSF